MRNSSPGVCQHLDLVIIEVDSMRPPYIRAYPTQLTHVLGRSRSKLFQAEGLLIGGLRHMRVKQDLFRGAR